MKKITCLCENEFAVDIPELVDLAEQPETLNSILVGDFMSIECPKCGKILKPEFPFRLIDKQKGLDMFFIPELDRIPYLMGKIDYNTGSPGRVVIGYLELVEKLTIFIDDMDDRVIESIKYYLVQKAVQTADNEEDILIYYKSKKDDILTFHISGLKKDEIAVSKMNMDMYNKIVAEIDSKSTSEPFCNFLTPPYVSINRIYIEK